MALCLVPGFPRRLQSEQGRRGPQASRPPLGPPSCPLPAHHHITGPAPGTPWVGGCCQRQAPAWPGDSGHRRPCFSPEARALLTVGWGRSQRPLYTSRGDGWRGSSGQRRLTPALEGGPHSCTLRTQSCRFPSVHSVPARLPAEALLDGAELQAERTDRVTACPVATPA